MAAGMAGQVAEVVIDKVSDKIENSKPPEPCVGPECCKDSSCMDLPGFHCDAFHGPTKCVGSSVVRAHRGTCACLHGSCGKDGRCPKAPGTLPSASASASTQVQPAPMASPPQPAPRSEAPSPAPAPVVAPPAPGASKGWMSVTELGNKVEDPQTDFLTWHGPSASARLFDKVAVTAAAKPAGSLHEDFQGSSGLTLSRAGLLGLAAVAALALVAIRGLRPKRSRLRPGSGMALRTADEEEEERLVWSPQHLEN